MRDHVDKATAWDELAKKNAEIARLRAVLKKISDDGKNCTDYCRRQAARALEQRHGQANGD